jgi:lipopolysaccharide/colanic/teichoic acid biosynthesis glycosyltransferase
MVRTQNITSDKKVYAYRRITSAPEQQPAPQHLSYLYIGDKFKTALDLHAGFDISYLLFSFPEALKLLGRLNKAAKLPSVILIDGNFEITDLRNFLTSLKEAENLKMIPVLAEINGHTREMMTQLAHEPHLTDLVNIADARTLAQKAAFYNKLQTAETTLRTNVATHRSLSAFSKFALIRLFDISFSAICIALLSPLMLVLALLVKLDGGNNIFEFSMERGLRYRTFRYIRFRTELNFVNQQIGDLCPINQFHISEKDGPAYQLSGNQVGGQVSKIGSVLRTTHLDELPALFNVLSGDISFISNR